MTSKTGGQKVVHYRSDILDCINQIYNYCREANFVDCRINAFPSRTEYPMNLGIKNKTPADFFMIDLDLKDFDNNNEKLNRTLGRTLKKLSQTFHDDSNPTILWTGNGYHVYTPLLGFILEKESVFFDFIKYLQKDLTTEFLRFVGPYFTKNNNDKQHMPSIKSCLLRIPGTYNSKNMQEIKVIQEWSGTRPAINYCLRDFRRYLIQKRISPKIERFRKFKSSVRNNSNFSKSKTTITWIEKLLSMSIEDYRKCSVNLILSPYLMNIKKTTHSDSCYILEEWLSKCNDIRRLDFNPNCLIKFSLNTALSKGIPPMRFDTLKNRNTDLFTKIKSQN